MVETYSNGGVVMHVITLLSAFAMVLLIRAGVFARRGIAVHTSGFVQHVIAAIVFVGMFGLVDNFRQVFEAVLTVEPKLQPLAFMRGASIAVIPLGWALAAATALVLWNGVAGHRARALPAVPQS